MVKMVKYDSTNSFARFSKKVRSHLNQDHKTSPENTSIGQLVLWQKKGPSIPAPPKSHQPPQHPSTLKEKERPRHFRLLPHVGAEKLARAIQHTAVARNRAALAASLLVDTLADKQVAACIHSSHNAQSCKDNGVSSRLEL